MKTVFIVETTNKVINTITLDAFATFDLAKANVIDFCNSWDIPCTILDDTHFRAETFYFRIVELPINE